MTDRAQSHPSLPAPWGPPGPSGGTAHAFGQGAMMGAAVGAMIGTARAADAATPMAAQAPGVALAAARDATRLGMAAGFGAAAASLVPAGGLVRGLAMVAVGAAVLAATASASDGGTQQGK